jgi:hypothetical protein
MKNRVKTLYCILLIVSLLFSSGGQMFGQGKVNISAGIGFPDLLNIGIKYRVLNQVKIGLSIGYMLPNKQNNVADQFFWGNLLSFAGDIYYHFAGSSKFSDMRPWYGRIGFNYIRDLRHHLYDNEGKYLYSYLRFGRDCYLNKNDGISIDAGLGINLYGYEGFSFIPAIGVCYFHRF